MLGELGGMVGGMLGGGVLSHAVVRSNNAWKTCREQSQISLHGLGLPSPDAPSNCAIIKSVMGHLCARVHGFMEYPGQSTHTKYVASRCRCVSKEFGVGFRT